MCAKFVKGVLLGAPGDLGGWLSTKKRSIRDGLLRNGRSEVSLGGDAEWGRGEK